MLGTMAGLWISILLLGIALTVFIVAAVGNSASENSVKVTKNSVLVLDLKGEIQERQQPMSFMAMLEKGSLTSPTLEELLAAVYRGAEDDKIEGIYIKCDGSAMGMASREELLEALYTFKDTGKWIVAYSDNYSQGDYLIASTADSLLLNPIGAVDIHGVNSLTPFFTGLLDKVGVKMQIIKVGTYKSAVEPYILKEMSEPARRQMQQYIDTVWSFAANTIAYNRNIPVDEINEMATQFMATRQGEAFVADSLVNALVYERTVDNIIRDLLGLDEEDDVNFVSATDYVASKDLKEILGTSADKPHMAILYAVGDIVDSGDGGIVGPDMVSEITELADDDNVKGMVLRVNSPGGSAFASEQIWEALQYFKSKEKPLYVSMGDYAASGGYYISCGADSIFADITTLTGSIGVFGMIPDLSGLVTGKLGITFSEVGSNENSMPVNTIQAMTPQQYAAMQKGVDNIYELFTGRVAAGRHMDIDSVKAIAEGRVWVGGDAVKLGLVDNIGTLHETISALAAELDMDSDQYVAYPQNEEKLWMKIMAQSDEFAKAGIDTTVPYDAETLRLLNMVRKLRTLNPYQARTETFVIK